MIFISLPPMAAANAVGAAIGDLGVAGCEGGNLRGVPSDPDDLGLNAVPCEKILPLGHPQGDRGCAHAAVRDHYLAGRSYAAPGYRHKNYY